MVIFFFHVFKVLVPRVFDYNGRRKERKKQDQQVVSGREEEKEEEEEEEEKEAVPMKGRLDVDGSFKCYVHQQSRFDLRC